MDTWQMTKEERVTLVDGLGKLSDADWDAPSLCTAPPGPATSWLGETIVHGEDIFRALGGYGEHPVEHVVAVVDAFPVSAGDAPVRQGDTDDGDESVLPGAPRDCSMFQVF